MDSVCRRRRRRRACALSPLSPPHGCCADGEAAADASILQPENGRFARGS
jgi:hypothetical protein